MGVDTSPATSADSVTYRLSRWTGSAVALRRLAIASVIANVVIVVTGGAVRLTGSGLGCPTWPTCTGASLTPTRAYSFHGVIEFTNRQLTFVLGVIAVATLVAAWRQRRQVRLAFLAFASIPAQAVLGGLTVLTDLNPWLVAAHFLFSMAIIAVTLLLWWRVEDRPTPAAVPSSCVLLALAVAGVAAGVLALGTIVTGSGAHSGAQRAGQRIGLHPSSITQLHADAVMALIGLTIGLLALLHAVKVPESAKRAAWILLGTELAQGAIGYTQYFLHVPALLVGFHMLGACLVWIAALRVLLLVEPSAAGPPREENARLCRS